MLIFVFSPYSDSRILLDAAISSLISCILSAIQSLLRISWSDSPLSILYGQYMILIYFIHKSIRCICKKSKSVLFTIASPGKQEPCLITPTFSIISNKICIAMSRASESIQSNRGASYHLYPIASGLNPQLAYAKLASFKKFLLSINQQIYR